MAKVKIYTTPNCPYCKMTKAYFQKNNVEYEEFDVSTDKKALDEMVSKSHQMGVPVIDMDNEIVIGFDRSAIDAALHLK